MRARAQSQDGFTLIEVLASALVVVLVSAAALIAFAGVTRSSYDDRTRSEAQSLAQQNEDVLRGYNINELSNLNTTLAPVTLDGTTFTIKETASYVTNSTGTPSCTNPSADYLQTVSTVSWTQMHGAAPVTVTGQLTPTVGSISSTNGGLAVSATNATGAPDAGMAVNISGASSASGVTAADGCVLFGDIPSGTYSVALIPGSGTYVDGKTGQSVTATTPDTVSKNVAAGTTPTSQPFSLDVPGAIKYSFADAFPTGGLTAPTSPTAPAVVAFNTNLTGVQYRVCTVSDTTCPAVGGADTSFPAADWSGLGGQVTATPLFPYTSSYSVYAGMCANDDPHYISTGSVADQTATVTAGGSASASLTLPAMVVKLYNGANTTAPEIALPVGSHLVITDTGCSVRYIGYTTTAPTVTAGQAAMPLNTSYAPPTSNDTGLLEYPGMPYGNYTVCYDNGTGHYSTTVTNTGSGEVVPLLKAPSGGLTSGTC